MRKILILVEMLEADGTSVSFNYYSIQQRFQLLLILNLLSEFSVQLHVQVTNTFCLNLMVFYSCRNTSQVENASVDESIWLKEKWIPGEVIVFCCPWLRFRISVHSGFSETFISFSKP
jgi:hypothetical protein